MSPAFTFRSFSANLLNLWHWALTTQGGEGKKLVAKSLAATLLLGGVASLPFYATAMALFQAVSGDDDDWTEQVRKAVTRYVGDSDMARDIACYGLPALAGVNLGGSLKMETPLTQGVRKGRTPKEVLTDSLGDILGIPYDLFVAKPSNIFDASRKGNTRRMAEELMPVALKNGMQAYRLMTEGQTTMTGRPINDPGKRGARKLSETEAVGKLFGFQPASSTKSYDAYQAQKRKDEVRGDKIDDLTVLALKTADTGEPAGRQEMLRELRTWNERMKAEGKPHMLINLKDVMKRVKSRRRENRPTPKAMQKQRAQAAVWG